MSTSTKSTILWLLLLTVVCRGQEEPPAEDDFFSGEDDFFSGEDDFFFGGGGNSTGSNCLFCSVGLNPENENLVLDESTGLTCFDVQAQSLTGFLTTDCDSLAAARAVCCVGDGDTIVTNPNGCAFDVAPGLSSMTLDLGGGDELTCGLLQLFASQSEANTTDCEGLELFQPICNGDIDLDTYECPLCQGDDMLYPDRWVESGFTCADALSEINSTELSSFMCYLTALDYSLTEFDIVSYCGCPASQPPQNQCAICNATNNEVLINTNESIPDLSWFTCGSLAVYAQYLGASACGVSFVLDEPEIHDFCCAAPTASPTATPSTSPSVMPSAMITAVVDSPPVNEEDEDAAPPATVSTEIDQAPVLVEEETAAPVAAPTSVSAPLLSVTQVVVGAALAGVFGLW